MRQHSTREAFERCHDIPRSGSSLTTTTSRGFREDPNCCGHERTTRVTTRLNIGDSTDREQVAGRGITHTCLQQRHDPTGSANDACSLQANGRIRKDTYVARSLGGAPLPHLLSEPAQATPRNHAHPTGLSSRTRVRASTQRFKTGAPPSSKRSVPTRYIPKKKTINNNQERTTFCGATHPPGALFSAIRKHGETVTLQS